MKNTRRPIKILVVEHLAGMGGAGKSLLLLLRNIDRSCFEPIVVIPRRGPLRNELHALGINTYRIKFPWWVRGKINIINFGYCLIREIVALFHFYRLVKVEQIDVIYTNTIVVFSGAILAFITKKPHIWHIREIIPGNPDLHFFLPHKILSQFVSRLSHRIITNSNATAAQFYECKAMEKIEVIHNAVALEELRASIPSPDIVGVRPEDWLVAVVGTLQKRKAQDDAIRAFKIAREKIPNIKLLLIGKGEKRFTNHLKELVSALGLCENVIFTGHRNDVPAILSKCKVLVMPSWEEPFGLVVIEAMALGIPVIGTNSGGVKELIKDSITGYLVPPRNPEEMAKKLVYLQSNPGLAKQMGNIAKKIAREQFNDKKYVRRIENVISLVYNKTRTEKLNRKIKVQGLTN